MENKITKLFEGGFSKEKPRGKDIDKLDQMGGDFFKHNRIYYNTDNLTDQEQLDLMNLMAESATKFNEWVNVFIAASGEAWEEGDNKIRNPELAEEVFKKLEEFEASEKDWEWAGRQTLGRGRLTELAKEKWHDAVNIKKEKDSKRDKELEARKKRRGFKSI